MKNTFFVFGCVSFFIAGCSPKVMTEVVKSYPVTRAYDVRLFEAKDTLPSVAEVLGHASVEKGTESDVETMVKVETAKVGGNAFAVKEKSSSFMGRSCRMDGYMLRFPGTRLEVDLALGGLAANRFWTDTGHEVVQDEEKDGTSTLYLNAGGGFLTSELRTPGGVGVWGHPRRGTEVQAGWDWVGQRGLGGGLFFSAYHSRAYGIESPLELADERFHMNFFYIGPEFVARLFFSDYWSVKTGLGLGAFFSREKVRGNSRLDYGLDGWGGHFQLGLEYRLAEHVGVGVNGGYVLGWFPGKDFAREFFSGDGLGELGDSGKHEGLDGCFHFFVTGGLRFYF